MTNIIKLSVIFFLVVMKANAGLLDEVEKANMLGKVLVRTDLKVLEFNDFAEDYLGRPTHVAIFGKKNKQTLEIEFEPYGMASRDYEPYLHFVTKHVDRYIEHIEKYLRWQKMALETGDAFGKAIGKAKSTFGLGHKYSFWSGNEKSHYLVIEACSLGSCDQGSFYFDKMNTMILLELLRKFKAGELPPEDLRKV